MNINNNPYQQQMNSYMPQYPAYQYNQMGNMQQRYQPQQEFQMQSGLFGKVVQDAENIIPSDVPMNGAVAFFPKSDLSEIYAKQWGTDGKISTSVFKTVLADNPNKLSTETEKLKFDLSENVTEVFEKHFDTLFSKIEELEKKIDSFENNCNVDEILLYIQKTNPEMTMEKLVEKLRKSEYAAKSLIFGAMNVKKLKC